MSFFIKKEEGERVMCKCQNQKMKWIIAISDTCNDEINLKFLTATEDEAKQYLMDCIDNDILESCETCSDLTESIHDIKRYVDCNTKRTMELHAYLCFQSYHVEYSAQPMDLIPDVTNGEKLSQKQEEAEVLKWDMRTICVFWGNVSNKNNFYNQNICFKTDASRSQIIDWLRKYQLENHVDNKSDLSPDVLIKNGYTVEMVKCCQNDGHDSNNVTNKSLELYNLDFYDMEKSSYHEKIILDLASCEDKADVSKNLKEITNSLNIFNVKENSFCMTQNDPDYLSPDVLTSGVRKIAGRNGYVVDIVEMENVGEKCYLFRKIKRYI